MDDFTDPSISTGPPPFFIAFGVLVGVVIVISICTAIYRAAKVARAGQNPLTLDNDIAVAALKSPILAAQKSVEERLRDVDDLHARGVISDAEHVQARAAILAG